MIKKFGEFIKEDFEDEDYLHGQCHQWVLDNYKPGDQIFVMTDYDYDINGYALVHCGLFRNGKYIDVSGEKNTEEEVLDDFDYGPELETEIMDLDQFKEFCKDYKLI